MLARLTGLTVASVIALAAPAFAEERYLALGDSYASGTGTREYRLGEQCERSHHGYPSLVAARRPALDLVLAACGGATSSDVRTKQVGRRNAATRWVTITIGGNDIGFSSALRKCGEPRSADACRIRIRQAKHRITEQHHLASDLDAVYKTIRERAPAATIIVIGYPRLFTSEDCNAATFFSPAELIALNSTASLLRDKIRERVAAAGPGFVFVDAIAAFGDHAVCSKEPWLNGLSDPTGESFHPNRAGHLRGYAPLVLEAMKQPQASPAPPARPPLGPPPPRPAPSPSTVSDRFSNDARLPAASEAFLRSADGRYRFVMQRDGNLVLYGPSGRALWASDTRGRGSDHVRMQGDGNLVIYDGNDRPLWQSNTPGNPNAFLIVQNDGNVVVYSGARAIWATGTNGQV